MDVTLAEELLLIAYDDHVCRHRQQLTARLALGMDDAPGVSRSCRESQPWLDDEFARRVEAESASRAGPGQGLAGPESAQNFVAESTIRHCL
jgi:hypothetical protein